jgi:hypothetical protein
VRPSAFLKTNTSKLGYQQKTYAYLFSLVFFVCPAKQARPQLTAADIEEILKWLADLWLTDEEVRKMITEDEWLKFIEAVIQALK